MDAVQETNRRVLWVKGLVNSFFVWALGFVIFMIPGIVIATKMGFELGPKTNDSAAVSAQISAAISEMYSSSMLLMGFYTGLFCVLIFWRAWVVSRGTGDKAMANGILVSSVPVVTSFIFAGVGGVDIFSALEILLFLGVGFVAGRMSGKAA